jgi:hypothetical protein
MAVDAVLGVVGEVGAELQEERSKVLVHAIKIVMVDHGRGFHNPRIGRSRARAAATLGPHDPRLFLGLANVQHALVPR